MPVGVGVLCAEHWADLKHSLQVTAKCHLLVQLWGLSKARGLAKIVEPEHISSSFRGTAQKFGRMDLDELLLVKEITEKHADCGLNSHDGLVSRHTEVNIAIVKPDILFHYRLFCLSL